MATKPAPGLLSARWVHLVMLNYQVDAEVLRPLVPEGTVLDTHGDRHFVSMVGFQFLETRVMGIAVPFHRSFDEVNLRFYVRRPVDGQVRRGVVFVKEIVPRRIVAWLANALYNENYVALPMSHDDELAAGSTTLCYSWKHADRWCRLGATLAGEPYTPESQSEEAFITEHYWGYARQRDGGTMEYQVEHPPWQVWQGIDPVFECDVAALYGPQFEGSLAGRPSSCFVAKGSEVRVRRGVRL